MRHDYISDLIETLKKSIGKMFVDFDDDGEPIIIQNFTEEDMLEIVIRKLSNQGKYNDAEDLLFEFMEVKPTEKLYNIGRDFYNSLLKKGEKELLDSDFTIEEIKQGLSDLDKLYKGKI